MAQVIVLKESRNRAPKDGTSWLEKIQTLISLFDKGKLGYGDLKQEIIDIVTPHIEKEEKVC